MAIMTRIVKIFKADIHGVMDQLEDQGLLLKQHLRDMEEALSQKETKLNRKIAARKQMQQDHAKYRQQGEALENDLKVALQKNKDDLARMLIKKMKPLEDLGGEFARQIDILDDEINRLSDCLQQQRLKYEYLKRQSADYFQRNRVQAREHGFAEMLPANKFGELSAGEIELELLKRKEAL
jgi:phage shock protein A